HVDWDSVGLSGLSGMGAAVSGIGVGHAADRFMPGARSSWAGRAVIAAFAGGGGVIGGGLVVGLATHSVDLSATALLSGAAMGMVGSHAHAEARPGTRAEAARYPVEPNVCDALKLADSERRIVDTGRENMP